MTPAPIILFAYKRAALTRQVLEALAANDLSRESTLYIFCDGAKPGADQVTLGEIAQTRRTAKERKWCGTVNVIERTENLGLAQSIIDGVTSVVNNYGKVIVLEDDICPTPYFLKYMNDALSMYDSEPGAFSIGACNFFATNDSTPETFFIKIPDCWGWATWKDRWKLFEQDGVRLHQQLSERKLMKDFNLSGIFNFEQMLIDQIKGKNNSWAIRWQAVAYLNGMLSLYPRLSVVKNLGFGEDATHGGSADVYGNTKIAGRPIKVDKIKVTTDDVVEEQMLNTYSRSNTPAARTFMSRVRSRITRLMR